MKKYWLMKTEPADYSIDDLKRDRVTAWTGIRNYQVRNFLRDEFSIGDVIIIYHSSTKNIGVVGEAVVVKLAYPDKTQFDQKSKYFDPASSQASPRWLAVDIEFVKKYLTLITLEQIKLASVMAGSPLVKKGNRLSIIPLTKSQYKFLSSQSKAG